MQSILANLTTFQKLDSLLIEAIGSLSKSHQPSFDFIQKYVPKSNQTFECNLNCNELRKKADIYFFKVEIMRIKASIGFGTFLRQNSKFLGISFDNENTYVTKNTWRKLCADLQPLEHHFHETLVESGKALGFNISLFDIPSFFKVSPNYIYEEELRQTYPLYSFCKNDHLKSSKSHRLALPSCKVPWAAIMKDSQIPERHPRNQLPIDDFCNNGTQRLFGSPVKQLPMLMLIMKYAYHLATYNDTMMIFEKLKNKLPYRVVDLPEKFRYIDKSMRPFIINFGKSNSFEQLEFEPVVTNNGLCYAWNNKRVDEIFKHSQYVDIFSNVFQPKKPRKKLMKAATKSVRFYLDAHGHYLPDRSQNEHSFR